MFSTYSPKFWEHRLRWFIMQSEAGLLGEIDYTQTGDGVIVCKDGFSAKTYSEAQFKGFISELNLRANIVEVDESSVFLVVES